MLLVSGKSTNLELVYDVFEFFTDKYEIESDVEIYHTDLSEENAYGFTEINDDEQFIQVHDKLSEEESIKTLFHELIHVVQNENGIIDDDVRESEAYKMEKILYNEMVDMSNCSL